MSSGLILMFSTISSFFDGAFVVLGRKVLGNKFATTILSDYLGENT